MGGRSRGRNAVAVGGASHGAAVTNWPPALSLLVMQGIIGRTAASRSYEYLEVVMRRLLAVLMLVMCAATAVDCGDAQIQVPAAATASSPMTSSQDILRWINDYRQNRNLSLAHDRAGHEQAGPVQGS